MYVVMICCPCRYNLSQVEQWVREQCLDMDDSGVLTSLAEIRQASQLLQVQFYMRGRSRIA